MPNLDAQRTDTWRLQVGRRVLLVVAALAPLPLLADVAALNPWHFGAWLLLILSCVQALRRSVWTGWVALLALVSGLLLAPPAPEMLPVAVAMLIGAPALMARAQASALAGRDLSQAVAAAGGAALLLLAAFMPGMLVQTSGLHLLSIGVALAAAGAWLLAPQFRIEGDSSLLRVPRVASLTQVAVAVVVLIGWIWGASSVVQGATSYVPMQFNTALGHLFAGTALWFALRGSERISYVLLIPIVLFAIPTLVVEFAGIDLGVDEAVFSHSLEVEGVPPGRMAPNTAMGFLIGALGTVMVSSAAVRPRHWIGVWSCGFLVSITALTVVAGYLLDVPGARGWGSQTPMALLTALAFAASGIGLLFAGRNAVGAAAHQTFWLPTLVFCGALVMALQLWLALGAQRDALALIAVERQADSLQRKLKDGIGTRLDALQRQGERLVALDDAGRERLFRTDAAAYLRDFPSLEAVAWVGPDRRVRLVESRHPDRPFEMGQLVADDPGRRVAFNRARSTGRVHVSDPLDLLSAARGVLIVVPVQGIGGEDLAGYLVGGLTFAELFPSLLGGETDHRFRMTHDDEVLFESMPVDNDVHEVSRSVSMYGSSWQLQVWAPRTARLDRIALGLLLGGILAGGWLALALRYSGLARRRAEDAERSREALEAELAAGVRVRSALDETERELASVLESISDAFYLLDSEWRFVFLNAEAAKLQGRSRDSLLGVVVWEAFPEAGAGPIRVAFERAVREQKAYVDEIHYPPLAAWFEVRAYPHRRGLAVYFHDITRIKLSELERRKREAELVRAQRLAQMGSWEMDLLSGQLHWSEQTCVIFGLPPGQQPRDLDDFLDRVHPDDRANAMEAQLQLRKGAEEIDIAYRILRPDGELRHVHEVGAQVRDVQSGVHLVTGAIQDVTASRRIELALEKERVFLRALFDSLTEGVVACDQDGVLTAFNQATRAFYGLPEEPIPTGRWADHYTLRHVDGTPMTREQMPLFRALAGEHVVDAEMLIAPRQAAPRIVECNGQPILGPDGEKLGAVVAMHDVTIRKRSERMQAGQMTALAGIAARRPLAESLDILARLHEAQFPESLCTILLLDESGTHVRHGAAPSLDQTFLNAIDGRPIGPAAGSCGTAAWRGERVVVADVAADPLWADYAPVAQQHGLRACWSTPVKSSGGKVLATFAVYYREPRHPLTEELDAVDNLVAIAAIAIEQGHAQRQLELSEQRFRSLFDEHPDAVFAMDMEGRFTSCNRGFERTIGAPAEGAIGRRFDNGIAEDQRDFVRRQFEAAMQGEARSYEAQAVIQDGRRIDLAVTNLPIMVDGRVTGVFGIAQDISLLRQRERDLAAALQHSESVSRQLRRLGVAAVEISRLETRRPIEQALVELLRQVVGARHAMLIGVGGGKRIVLAESRSDSYRNFLRFEGGPAPELLEISDGEDPGVHRVEAHGTASGAPGTDGRSESYPPLKGLLVVPLTSSSGRSLGTLVLNDCEGGQFNVDDEAIALQFARVASAALERSDLLSRMRDSEERLRAVLETASEGIITIDESGRIDSANAAVEDLFGFENRELVGRNVRMLMPEPYRSAHDGYLARYRETGQAGIIGIGREVQGRRKDGSVFPMDLSVSEVRLADRRLFSGFVRDITERRRAADALNQALEDLRIRNRELQDFAFVASHDLQEPLRKIRAFAGRLQTRYAQQLDDQGLDYLERTAQAATRMQVLIDDLLAYSRVSSRARPFAPVDLNQVAAAVLQDLEALLEASGGAVDVDALPVLEGDPTQLRQVLQNLIANALKFRAPDRVPQVRIGCVRVTLDDGRPGWEVTVEDNGIGFDAKYAERIFAPFQRLHTREQFAGTGIGLAIVRRIVERHRGTVRAEAVPGKGARFVLVLPERQTAQGAAPTEASRPSSD